MTVRVFIITHEGIGEALLATACRVFPHQPLRVRAFAGGRAVDSDACLRSALTLAELQYGLRSRSAGGS